MTQPPLPVAVAYLLAAGFAIVGIVQFAGAGFVRRAYRRWQYPPYIFRLTGAVELLAALLLAIPSIRPLGVALGTGINFICVVLLLKNRAYLLSLPGMAVMLALPLIFLPAI